MIKQTLWKFIKNLNEVSRSQSKNFKVNMIQDSNLNLVQSKEMTYQHQMPISFNLGKLPLLVQTSNTERIITKPV